MPNLTSPTSPRSAAGHRASGHHKRSSTVTSAVAQAAPSRQVTEALAIDSVMTEMSEPERSLMPRKNELRKVQQELLKSTDVSIYKVHLKKHLQRILDAVELQVNDKNGRRDQVGWNLAKPLTMAEIKQFASVGARTSESFRRYYR